MFYFLCFKIVIFAPPKLILFFFAPFLYYFTLLTHTIADVVCFSTTVISITYLEVEKVKSVKENEKNEKRTRNL